MRPSKIVALEKSDADRRQSLELCFRFHAFRENLNPQVGRNARQPPHDRLSRFAVVDASQDFHIDLDQVGLKFGEQPEPGVTRPEIIQRGQEAEVAIGG